MAGFSAVPPGTDLPVYARSLTRAHDAILSGNAAGTRVRPVVARSWSRMLASGLDPASRLPREPVPIDELEARRRRSLLGVVVEELARMVEPVADASQLMMVVTDADGVILWRRGSAHVRRHADRLGFCTGARWGEPEVGTNAIGTALAERAPVQLFSAEHFEQAQHPWYCTAGPVHDPRSGELLGTVDLSGPALTLHPTVIALVTTAVRLAESQLWRLHEQQLERLRTSSAAVLSSVHGPALLVDDHGWVAHADGVATAERVAAPRSGRPLHVPGLGLCMPEQVTGGWLIRSPSRQGCAINLTVELAGEPAIEVAGPESTWRSALPARHAEILLVLQRSGRSGMSAAGLSRALYGDDEHLVTVRAEVSRLRRALGAIVESRPYRLAESVRMFVDTGGVSFAECKTVSMSTAPAVRELVGEGR